MAATVPEFKAAFPAFESISQGKVGAALDSAEAGTDATAFGADYERAVFLLAAHLLLQDPTVGPTRKASKSGDYGTPYMVERKRIARGCVFPVIASGGC